MKKDINNEMYFWQFLSRYEVEIPKIQRDYAQGRREKSELRRSFLKNILQALKGENQLKMDFVYGSEEGRKLAPLDGQQRLTTLWLLHWYIALKSGHLSGENAEVRATLRNFSYSTRVSSREFCKQLSNVVISKDIFNVKDYITQQTWFYSSWKQDPTIQSMLRMLSGTYIKGENDSEVKAMDGIEQVFCDEDYDVLWEKLTNSDCPIRFYYLDLLGLKLTDDLYIKMNARGKPLSSFENFKADLIGYLSEKEKESDQWKVFNSVNNGFPIKLDTSWAMLFWNANKQYWIKRQQALEQNGDSTAVEFHIDSPYFAFFNRIFFNLMVSAKKKLMTEKDDDEDSSYLYKADSIDNTNNVVFNYLYGRGENQMKDNAIEYSSFDYYCYMHEDDDLENRYIPEEAFRYITSILDNVASCTNEDLTRCFPARHKNHPFNFIPVYESNKEYETIVPFSQTDRVLFFSICKYFEQGRFEEASFKQWMRVVWNIVDAVDIDTIAAMVGRMRRIEKISSDTHKIYQYLNQCSSFTKNGQLEEERIKAKEILEGTHCEDVFVEAENLPYFKGSIRFLYQNDNGNVDWENFDLKLSNSRNVFTDHLINSTDASHMKKLFSYMNADDFNNCLWWHYRVFNNSVKSWRYFLLNEKLYGAIHNFLLDKPVPSYNVPENENESGNWIFYLSHGTLLDFVMKKIPSSWIRWYHDHAAIYPSGTGVFLNAGQRDRFLTSTEGVTIQEDFLAGGTETRKFLWGTNIPFEFSGYPFIWDYHNQICVSENQNAIKVLINTNGQDSSAIINELQDYISRIQSLSLVEN